MVDVGGDRREVGELAEVAGSIHINSPVCFLFAFLLFICSFAHLFIFQIDIKHEYCEFPQEDV
jgi:hypothetical protein